MRSRWRGRARSWSFSNRSIKGGLEGVTPGSSCIANAYSNNHDIIVAKETGDHRRARAARGGRARTGACLILRLQALMLPFKTLVFSGH